MKNKILALVAFKIAVIGLWLLFGSNGFRIDQVFAEASKETPETKKADVAKKKEDDKSVLAAILRRQKELEVREEELKTREERLLTIKSDIEARISELNQVHGKIEAVVKKIDEINDVRVKKLVKIYESMNPEEAASRIEKLDEDMAVMILASVSEKKAAKILGFVDVGKSVKLSQSLKVKN
ncbi:MAG: hypothetical protein HY954_06470 [Deltaproteobacteria bacterium]|nr:hypothetical protein [Deltaproteobacteria bacterium]